VVVKISSGVNNRHDFVWNAVSFFGLFLKINNQTLFQFFAWGIMQEASNFLTLLVLIFN
jgi:hypothetical protein